MQTTWNGWQFINRRMEKNSSRWEWEKSFSEEHRVSRAGKNPWTSSRSASWSQLGLENLQTVEISDSCFSRRAIWDVPMNHNKAWPARTQACWWGKVQEKPRILARNFIGGRMKSILWRIFHFCELWFKLQGYVFFQKLTVKYMVNGRAPSFQQRRSIFNREKKLYNVAGCHYSGWE